MKPFLVATFLLGLIGLGRAESQDNLIVDQRDYADSNNACGPASILNCLKFSRPEFREIYGGLLGSDDGVKMRFVHDRYFRLRDSVVYLGQRRWGIHVVATADLVAGMNVVAGMNELLLDRGAGELSGAYLDRAEGKASLEFAKRIHGMMRRSVERGVSPILSLRAFYVRQQEDKDGQPAWETGPHHNVVVTTVGDFQASSGFMLTALDPREGREIAIYLYREGAQSFRALKGVEPGGEWLNGRSFLVAAAPEAITLQPGKLEWHERFVIVANFLIGDF